MNRYGQLGTLALWAMVSPAVYAQHDIEEVIVTSPLAKKAAQTALPVNVISGEALRESVAGTLGETLQNQMGVSSASFGPGVGLPIIRGQSGNRVRVLQSGISTADASAVSPDHANSTEPLLAERIEVVRGPATLLYGNGAIGGVVNVIDNRIPDAAIETFSGAIEQRHNTVADINTSVFKIESGSGPFAWHLDGLYRHGNNVEIEGLAIDEQALEALHDDEEVAEEEHEEVENTHGFIGNSDTEAKALNAGASWIGDSGFLGFSVGRQENNYGLPAGTHGAHHDEEPGAEEEAHEEEAAANVRIDMKQTRWEVKGARDLDGFFTRLHGHLAYSDYEHEEVESGGHAEEEEEEEAGHGTVFSNEGVDARFTLKHRPVGLWQGVFGMHISDGEFGAEGEEAFIPTSDIQSLAVFAVEGIELDRWLYEFGLRVENHGTEPSSRCDRSETTWSGSASALWQFREDSNLFVSLARSERAPTIEELFSNIESDTCSPPIDEEALVAHAATNRIEIGNADMDVETSFNIEIGLRKHLGNLRGELNFFYNDISDYIFLFDTDEEIDEVVVSEYRQNDATFAGYEAELTLPVLTSAVGRLDLTLFSDYVRATFADTPANGDKDVPRIPPLRYGMELAYLQEQWSVKVRVTEVGDQDKVAVNEVETEGYTLVNLYTDYHFTAGKQDLTLFAKGSNLLDEEIRNHASFLRNFAPEPGRGFEMGVRYTF